MNPKKAPYTSASYTNKGVLHCHKPSSTITGPTQTPSKAIGGKGKRELEQAIQKRHALDVGIYEIREITVRVPELGVELGAARLERDAGSENGGREVEEVIGCGKGEMACDVGGVWTCTE